MRFFSSLSLTLTFLLVSFLSLAAARAERPPLPEATWQKLPTWHGFNLLNRFHLNWQNKPFEEKDFQLMAGYGFNFVRLPMDYRTYIVDGDWLRFDESVLADIDQAIAWGDAYQVHVQLNLHRIPGYTVASPAEPTSLWTDETTQAVAAAHWGMFAARYKGIPNARLSFNLLNEPAGELTGEAYAAVVKVLCDAIRAEDPDRLIVADGLDWGSKPVPELIPLQVAQSKHNYEPFNLTHYKANWVDGSDRWAVPEWPGNTVSTYLYGSDKAEFQSSLVIQGPFEEPARLRIRMDAVSGPNRLTVTDGETILFAHDFDPGPGEGEWETVVYNQEWDIYQNIYDRDYLVDIPAGTSELSLRNTEGDWMTLVEVGIEADGVEATLSPGNAGWGVQQREAVLYSLTKDGPVLSAPGGGRLVHWDLHIQPWKDLEAMGVGVMVGEFGVYNKTPHPVTLAWMRDMLENYAIAGWGWSLWNLRDAFGPMDSGRSDVTYETIPGAKLDRAMMDLLQEFAGYRENYTEWINRVYPSGSSTEWLGPDHDANGDGMVNLLAYSLGRDPIGSDEVFLPRIMRDEPDRVTLLRFPRSRRSVGVRVGIETSPDMDSWTPLASGRFEAVGRNGDHEILSVGLPGFSGETFFYRFTTEGPP